MYSLESPQFALKLGNLLGPPVLACSHVAGLYDGDEIFPLVLRAIHDAQQHQFRKLHLLVCPIGRQFADVLAERARAASPVRARLPC